MKPNLETLTTTKAAVAAGVSVEDVNRAIDRRVLPEILYRASEVRTLRRDACLWIAFWFETADRLTPSARQRIIAEGARQYQSWAELRTYRLQESRTIELGFQDIWEEVDARLKELDEAQQMVVEDPEILSGTPIVRGSRIPVHDVASLVDRGTPMEELRQLYPRLSPQQFRLASVYARARPLRGRPKRRSLPNSSKVSATRTQLQQVSQGRAERAQPASR